MKGRIPILNRKPAIIFDWDGTLADSMELCIEEVRLALTRMGLPVPPEGVIRQCNGPTFEESIPLLGIPRARAEEYLRVRLQAGLELCPRVNRLFPGIRELLLSLRDRAELCIASNGTADYLSLCQQVFGLEGVFRAVRAAQHGRTKALAVGEILAELQPCAAVMVGDRLGDIEAGKANGLPTLCAGYGYGDADEWAAADQVAEDVASLQRLLERFIAGAE
ncbi:MAG: HAD family hydrolase [Aristaeellaceae bacterium]